MSFKMNNRHDNQQHSNQNLQHSNVNNDISNAGDSPTSQHFKFNKNGPSSRLLSKYLSNRKLKRSKDNISIKDNLEDSCDATKNKSSLIKMVLSDIKAGKNTNKNKITLMSNSCISVPNHAKILFIDDSDDGADG